MNIPQIILNILGVFALTFLVFIVIQTTSKQEAIFAAQANCIAATAKAQGYTGNVHGPEAYDLFIDSCR